MSSAHVLRKGREMPRMLLAVSVSSDGMVSPFFDSSKEARLVEFSGGSHIERRTLAFDGLDGEAKIEALHGHGAEMLFCGGISRCLEAYARSYGIEVEPFLCGPMEAILKDFTEDGEISSERRTPVCPGRMRLNGGCRRRMGHCGGRKR